MRCRTRRSTRLDRASSAWPIGSLPDPDAELVSVADPAQGSPGATRSDLDLDLDLDLDMALRGLPLVIVADEVLTAATEPLFDGTSACFRRGLLLGREPA